MSLTVDNSRDAVSDRAWGAVNKTALNAACADVGGPGDPTVAQVKEIFAYCPPDAFTTDDDGDQHCLTSHCKLPHHEISGGKIVINRGGVHAAYAALQGSRGGVDLPGSAHAAALAHIKRHYVQMGDTPGGDAAAGD